jgi:hypothetical protein
VPLARDLPEFGIRCGRPGDDELVFGEWSGDTGKLARAHLRAAAIAAGLPDDTIPRDVRGSFASLLIFGPHVLEVALEPGDQPSTCLDIYGRLFEEFDTPGADFVVDLRKEAMKTLRDGMVPTGCPG